ncbi:TPA: hypothetical protein ACGE7W_002806 [Enterococcus faecium]
MVDSIFLGNYLTEKGADVTEDYQLLKELELIVEGDYNEY